jgi:MFS family permease
MTMSPERRARVAITVIFALNGVLFASIFSRLPAIKERVEIGDGALGLALLCAMLGLLASQVVAGALVARLGSRPLVVAGAVGYAVALVPLALAGSFAALALAFAFAGLANGFLDVAMNVHGLTVERRLGRPILSTLHAALSFGALGGAVVSGLVAGAGLEVVPHFAGVAALGVIVALPAGRFLLASGADAAPQGPKLAVPSRALALVGAFAFCVLLAEGAVNDWAAIYLDDEVGTGEATAAAGLAAFSLTMGFGRLFGDRLNSALGAVRLARGGGALAAAGIATALAAASAPAALVGFACAGIGLAALFPLALRAAAARGETEAPAVAAVSAVGYLGFLAGPPAIGGLSELAGLRTALLLVAVLCLVAAALATSVRAPRPARSR